MNLFIFGVLALLVFGIIAFLVELKDAFLQALETKNDLKQSRVEVNEAIAEKISELDINDPNFTSKLTSLKSNMS